MTASWARSSVLAAAALLALAPAVGRSAAPGEIVFSSDRAWDQPGEVYVARVGAEPRDVSRSPYADAASAVSPRGGAVAYWTMRSGTWRVLVARPDGSHARSAGGVTQPAAAAPIAPVFSPDGRTLAIVRASSNAGRVHFALYLSDVATGHARRIAADCGLTVAWSADSRLLVCSNDLSNWVEVLDRAGRSRLRAPGNQGTWSPLGLLVSSNRVVTAYDLALRRQVRYRGHLVDVSPDGRLLLIENRTSVFLQRVGGAARLVLRSGAVEWLRLTPDGRGLAVGTADGRARLLPVAGGRAQTIVQPFGTWSPDGRHYAYYQGPERVQPGSLARILVGDRLGRHPVVVARFVFDDHGSLVLHWLPDSKRLLYEQAGNSAGSDLWAVHPDGSGLRRLTRDPRNQVDPVWSPDGSVLVYAQSDYVDHNCSGCSMTLWRAGADLSSPVRLTGGPADGSFDSDPSFAPDGQSLAYTHETYDSQAIARVVLDGSPPFTVRAGAARPAWSPDGSTIAFGDARGVEGVPATGGAVRLLVPKPGAYRVDSVAWSPDGKLLAFAEGEVLYVAPADGSAAPRRLTLGAQPSFSPDGRQLVFLRRSPLAGVRGAMYPQRDLAVIGVDGRGEREVRTTIYDEAGPAWRPGA